MSFHDELKSFTDEAHKRLEKNLDIFERLNSLENYKQLIARLYGFYSPMEDELATTEVGFESKVPLLEKDLATLGVEEIDLCPKALLPSCTNQAQAMGILYVLEGSSLGGQIIAKQVKEKLNLDADTGVSYYVGKGPKTMDHWREFKERLAAAADTPQTAEQIKVSAQATFESMERWLCNF